MHTIKLHLTYCLNISVQAANLSDCRIESNRKNRFGSENRIESNRNFFCPNWKALPPTPLHNPSSRIRIVLVDMEGAARNVSESFIQHKPRGRIIVYSSVDIIIDTMGECWAVFFS